MSKKGSKLKLPDECPYCGSELVTYCSCCEQPWCPMCDRHIELEDIEEYWKEEGDIGDEELP